MNINERIKAFRKEKKWSQKQFASLLGVTQSGVSYMEQSGSTVSDSSIKTICTIGSLNEDWLRYGTEPMYIQPPTFSLDDFVKSKGATELELDIVKAYFDIDPDTRKMLVQHFKERLTAPAEPADPRHGIPNTPEELERQFPPVEPGNDESGVG